MNDTPYLWQQMQKIVDRSPLSAHTPGHKNGRYLPQALQTAWGGDFARYDLTEVDGLDNLHFSAGCIAESQRQAARIFDAKATYYLVGGTTSGLQAAMMAACRKRQVFVPRHAHRSIYHSLILAQAEPIYLPITLDEATGLPLGVAPEVLAEYAQRYPRCRHLLIVNPTYQGITWRNMELTQLAKELGLCVIVDEAHGSHLHFHPDLPPSLLDMGADLVVQSWHKTLPVLTQGSALHIGAGYDGPDMAPILSLLTTTSPSYLTMASLEAGAIWIGGAGRGQLDRGLRELAAFFDRLEELTTLQRLWEPALRQDPFKLYLISDRLSGPALSQRLQEDYAIYAEMSDTLGVLLMLPLAADASYLDRLEAALRAIDRQSASLAPIQHDAPFYAQEIPRQALALDEAFFRPARQIPWTDACGKISAGFIIKYPPGIPICVPGEVISPSIVEQWLSDPAGCPSVTILNEE